MDPQVVVGVGNIYASEALYRAGIRPDREAGRIGRERYHRLAGADTVLSPRRLLGESLARKVTTGVASDTDETVESIDRLPTEPVLLGPPFLWRSSLIDLPLQRRRRFHA